MAIPSSPLPEFAPSVLEDSLSAGAETQLLFDVTHTMAFGALMEKPGSVFLESIGTQFCKAPRSSRHPAIIVTSFGIDATFVLRAS
jgi:hypothetical protein